MPQPWSHCERASSLESGDGYVDVERVCGKSAVVAASARSPLKLVFPKNHGEAAWVFTSSFGGGYVDGDRVRMSVRVGEGAAVWLTSQAAGKVYRSQSGAVQELTAEVAASGLLVVAPDPISCFASSRFEQRARIAVAEGASVVFVDAVTAGRVASGERWALDSYRSRVEVESDGRRLLCDAIELVPAHGPIAARLGRFDALATVVAIGPRPELSPLPRQRGDVLAVRSATAGGALWRIAAETAGSLAASLRALLSPLAANLGDDPFARKW